MAKSFRVIRSCTGLEIGQTITDDELTRNYPGLGGAGRLLELKSIEPIAEKAERPTKSLKSEKLEEGK